MAGVFLSYDREDGGKARSIALALEKAGHSVWWDRNIKGGAEYSKEIEQALERADVVIVLWSEHSVNSAWVRDEAAAGRDSGRLVPVQLDSTPPPMGFRQYQAIDYSRAGKRAASLADLLSAIGGSAVPRTESSQRAQTNSRSQIAWTLIVAASAFALLAFLLWQQNQSPDPPSVTVTASDNNARVRALASDLLVKLGSLQSSRAESLELVEPDSAHAADFAFKVGGNVAAGDPRASLSLVDRSGTLLWSREFVQPGGNEADLRQQIAYSAGQVLSCATEALSPTGRELDLPVLKLYLNGCADLSTTTDPLTTIPLFRQVTVKAPQFAAGWSKLLIAELEAFKQRGGSDDALQNDLRQHVAEARKLDRELAEVYLVQSWLQPPRPIRGWMRFADEALEKNPDNARILENHAIGLSHFGRLRDAVEHARRATQAEPLSPGARQTLIGSLMDSGALAAARRELGEAERLWPGANNLLQMRFWLEYRYGDPNKAASLLESGRIDLIPRPEQTSFLKARIHSSPTNIQRAVADARAAYRRAGAIHEFIQTLAALGLTDETIAVLLSTDPQAAPGVISVFFRPHFAAVRRDPRFLTIAKRYGLIDYWSATGRWPDFCSEPDLPYDCKAEAAKLS